MNIYVCIKQVPDTEAVLTIKEGKFINEENIKWIISPYEEIALELALQLKEKNPGFKVILVTVGPARAESAIRSGLAMGAETAIHVESDQYLNHKTIARALAKAIKDDGDGGIIFTGKQAIDDDASLTHIYLAESLGIPVATNVIGFRLDSDKAIVEREIDQGARERIEMQIPCVVAATKGINDINQPRYATLMGIMKAKKIPIKKVRFEDLGIEDSTPTVTTEKLEAPPEKPAGKIIEGEMKESIKELVKLLKEEAKVL
ncbi:MAG: electron transfer flavoprotein subunit beta/FixA family protein [Candidatus Aminicenantes bacterium]|nr:electron transfer flavoprotein subunit beta/FixA family protein [Candidatus Aminicenantes bacterium]